LKQSGFKETNISIFAAMTGGWNANILKLINHLNEKINGNTNP
jgi:hypothetical protein